MINDIEILKTYREIGCEYVIIPYVNPEHRSGGDKFGELIESAKKIGAKANELGMKLAYHNHDFEFEKINGEYALDVLYKEVPANLLQTELDTCWVNVVTDKYGQHHRRLFFLLFTSTNLLCTLYRYYAGYPWLSDSRRLRFYR